MADFYVEEALGDSCPDVEVDLQRRHVLLLKKINFLKNKAKMVDDSKGIVRQVRWALGVRGHFLCAPVAEPRIRLRIGAGWVCRSRRCARRWRRSARRTTFPPSHSRWRASAALVTLGAHPFAAGLVRF